MDSIKKPLYHFDAVFFSPHVDDAVLSATGRIVRFIHKKKRVCVVTVFTEGSEMCETADSQKFLARCGAATATALFSDRKREDWKAMRILGIDAMHLPFVDGLFRTNALYTNRPIYPSFRHVFSGQVSRHDLDLGLRIVSEFRNVKKRFTAPGTHIFAPLGVGNHVDHIMTRDAVLSVFHHRVVFWEDVPYRWEAMDVFRQRMRLEARLGKMKQSSLDISKYERLKRRAVSCYRSQLSGLADGGLG